MTDRLPAWLAASLFLALAQPGAAQIYTPTSAAPSAEVPAFTADATQQIATYGETVFRNYREAWARAVDLQAAVARLVVEPGAATLDSARAAWLAARPSYGESEAYRYYGGPIDAGKQDDFSFAPAGVEGLLNAWPLNEAYIDRIVAGKEPITRALLVRSNARDDEADVTTGFHAVEYLLWGRDTNADGPGARSAGEFAGAGDSARRREYLSVATDLLVSNLKTLVDAWEPGRENYRATFQRMDQATAVRNMLTGIATLTGFEMASERLATALDSGSQEDEQSCFSDNTHVDLLSNALGVANVYFGRYGGWQGKGLNELVAAANPDLNRYLEQRIEATVELARKLPRPFDRMLASPPGSPERQHAEQLVQSLQMQADLLKYAASALGVPIVIGDND
jgi:putative iron-regulated protein